MRDIRIGDKVRVFGLEGRVIGMEDGLYQIEIGADGGAVDAVVFAPAKHVFLEVWYD